MSKADSVLIGLMLENGWSFTSEPNEDIQWMHKGKSHGASEQLESSRELLQVFIDQKCAEAVRKAKAEFQSHLEFAMQQAESRAVAVVNEVFKKHFGDGVHFDLDEPEKTGD